MPRGITTLEQIVANIRHGSNRSADRNFGIDQYAAIAYLAQNIQTFLYWDFDWGFLNAHREIAVKTDQRFYDVPSDMEFERIKRVRCNANGSWYDLERGIDPVLDYNDYDPDDDEKSVEPLKWDIVNTVDEDGNPSLEEQIEIWPIPAADSTVKFAGMLKLGDFVSDNDVCTLDNTLIELFGQAELLEGDKNPMAKTRFGKGNRMYNKMKAGSARRGPVNTASMSAGGQPPVTRRRTVVIAPEG